jgi:transcriptional regulator with XRE-family HTH domain
LVKDSDKKKLKIFGANIKRLREGKQLSLLKMSYACNIDNSKIAKIEKGGVNITFTTLIQLAEALEIHPS